VKLLLKSGKIENLITDAVTVFCIEGENKINGVLKDIDKLCKRRLSELFGTGDFKGEAGQTSLLYAPENSNIKRILLVGLGKKDELSTEKVRRAFGTAAKFLNKKKIKKAVCFLPGNLISKNNGIAAAEGAILSIYNFNSFKTDDKNNKKTLSELTFFESEKTKYSEFKKGLKEGRILAEGVCYARDLANTPPNTATPTFLANQAKKFSKETGLKCTIFDKAKLEKMKMNALLGVAKGSKQPPKMMLMEYKSGKKGAKTVALVGKGITFDSGGISLKPSKKMEEMKFDMCGAAAVMGTMKIISELKPPVNVVGVVVTCENLPGGNALKPSDVIKTYSGQTVEVINTDAEGRLVLCDALSYTSKKIKPSGMIDLATLTGAVVVALGHYASGMLGNERSLLDKVKKAGDDSGDMVWELPIFDEFEDHLKSKTADMVNSNGPGGGTIYGACFLQKFVGDTPWVHLDIAGTAWGVEERSYIPNGGPTGVGVRLLSRLVMDWK